MRPRRATADGALPLADPPNTRNRPRRFPRRHAAHANLPDSRAASISCSVFWERPRCWSPSRAVSWAHAFSSASISWRRRTYSPASPKRPPTPQPEAPERKGPTPFQPFHGSRLLSPRTRRPGGEVEEGRVSAEAGEAEFGGGLAEFGSVQAGEGRVRGVAVLVAGAGCAAAGVVEGSRQAERTRSGWPRRRRSSSAPAGASRGASRRPGCEFGGGEEAEGPVGGGPFREVGCGPDRGISPGTTDTSGGEILESFDTRTGNVSRVIRHEDRGSPDPYRGGR